MYPDGKDYCSYFPDKFLHWDWGYCCKMHDKRYERYKCLGVSRYQADVRMRNCITKKTFFLLGLVMFIGVRLMGWYFWKKK